jgi:hypothetical protein
MDYSQIFRFVVLSMLRGISNIGNLLGHSGGCLSRGVAASQD